MLPEVVIRIATNLAPVVADRVRSSYWSDGVVTIHRLKQSGELQSLSHALREWPGAGEFERVTRYCGDAGHSLDVDDLAEWLLLRAAEADLPTAFAELEAYGASADYEATFTLWLSGLSVTTKLELADSISLVPFKPEFWRELAYVDADQVTFDASRDGIASVSSILTTTVRHPKVLRPQDAAEGVPAESQTFAREVYERLNIARLCCGIVEPREIAIQGRYARISASVPAHLRSGFGSHALTPQARAGGYVYQDFVDRARTLHEPLAKMSLDERAKLALPMEWLQRALHERNDFLSCAISLGIALESLLLEDEDTSELAYRLSLRGARLIAVDREERARVRRLFKAIYALRSKTVHRGQLTYKAKDLAGRANPAALLEDGIASAAHVTRTIILRRGIDWSEFDIS
jgi:hypothetical protein